MKFLAIRSYDNYVPAHIAMGRLKEDGIQGWLMDENTTTVNPILGNAIGGIKLMVPEPEADKAIAILIALEKKHNDSMACPNCFSNNIELVSSPRKATNWLSAISTFFLTNFAIAVEKEYHCFNCKKEFKEPIITETLEKDGTGFSS